MDSNYLDNWLNILLRKTISRRNNFISRDWIDNYYRNLNV